MIKKILFYPDYSPVIWKRSLEQANLIRRTGKDIHSKLTLFFYPT